MIREKLATFYLERPEKVEELKALLEIAKNSGRSRPE
jgi:hypothetical protein